MTTHDHTQATDAEIANIRRRIHINDNDPGDIIAGQALAYACRHILPDILNRLDASEKECEWRGLLLRFHGHDIPDRPDDETVSEIREVVNG